MSLYESAIKKPVTYTMIFLILLGFGIASLTRLKPELLPTLTFPMVVVNTTYEGASPENIETLITRPIEEILATVPDVDEINSTSRKDSSMVIISFEWGKNMDVATADIREKLDLIRPFFPSEVDTPVIVRLDPTMLPVLSIGVSGPQNLVELRTIAENNIAPNLERISGVALVDVRGGLQRQINVLVDRQRLEFYQLSLTQVSAAISASNLDLPVGEIDEGKYTYAIKTAGEFTFPQEIENIIIGQYKKSPVYLRDVAKVEDSYKEIESEARINGKSAVILTIQKMSGANTVEVSQRVKDALEEIKKGLPQGIELTVLSDQAKFINLAVNTVVNSLWQGAILAILVLFFFLHNFRSTLVVAISVPVSVIVTFIFLDLFGLTLNIVSLSGLALAVGMLVDNSIVVLENIFRYREKKTPPLEAAVLGTSEMSLPIMASTLTTIAVFIPIFLVPGIAGILFRELALTVTVSLIISLLFAFTLVPLLSSRFIVFEPDDGRQKRGWSKTLSNKIKGWIESWKVGYAKALGWCLRHRKTVIGLTVVVFLSTISLIWPFHFVGVEFIPQVDQGMISINIELPVSTRLEETLKVVSQVEKIVLENVDELEKINSNTGGMGMMGAGLRSERATVNLELVELSKRERSQWEIAEDLRKKFRDIPGAEITVESGGMAGGAITTPIEIEIYGNDLEEAEKISKQITEIVKKIEGTRNVESTIEEKTLEYEIILDKEKAAFYGLNEANVATALRANIFGTVASRYREKGEEYDILVRLSEDYRDSIKDLENIPLLTPRGADIPLKMIAQIRITQGPRVISRRDQQRIVTVTSSYFGRDLAGVSRDIQKSISQITLPSGFSIKIGGEVEEQQESFFWLAIALIGAIVLIYMIMASQFESFLDPFIVLFTFPLAIIGVIWLFFFTGEIFSIIAFMGVIILSGIIVNNGIVLVDYINLLREREMPLFSAIIQAGSDRLRPVLMTAITTILGVFPLALGIGEGAEIGAPLGLAIVGGLTMGTFLTLFLIPVMYSLFETHVKKGEK